MQLSISLKNYMKGMSQNLPQIGLFITKEYLTTEKKVYLRMLRQTFLISTSFWIGLLNQLIDFNPIV